MAKANGTGTANGSDTEGTDAKDAPLLDLNEASVKKLLARAKKRGYITYDELNEALPQDQMSSPSRSRTSCRRCRKWASTSSKMMSPPMMAPKPHARR